LSAKKFAELGKGGLELFTRHGGKPSRKRVLSETLLSALVVCLKGETEEGTF